MAATLTYLQLGSLGAMNRSIDSVALEERAATLAKRSIKRQSKLALLDLAVRCIDLTTLEGADTPGRVQNLCQKAMHPDPLDASVPPVAAVCVYPSMVSVAKLALAGSPVRVASVATAFPSGQSSIAVKVEETAEAVENGADEIDMVLNRGAFLAGDLSRVVEEISAVKEACGQAHLKVILETGELGTYDAIHQASMVAMAAGADFIKTSTGKIPSAATLPVALVMLEALRDFYHETGRVVGFKPAGGIRTAKEALAYLVLLYETNGVEWMVPDRFRLGASTLLNDVLMQRAKELSGCYQSDVYYSEA